MSCGLLPDHPELVFRINDNGAGPELLRQVFLERGWSEFDEETQHDQDWNLWWRTSRFRTSDYDLVYPWQRLNHYPKSTLITKKDALARNLKRMQCVHGASVFNFSPLSFNLPNDYTKYVKVYESMRQKTNQRTSFWICKPADLSRGRGIFIFRDLSDLLYDCNAVVQFYIDNPLLIGGYKSDLRIYVAVTSFQPLKVYVHEEGIVRFSTEKFDLSSTKNVFAHLTNTSINKHSPGYTEDKEQVGPGCKWTLTQLRRYFLSSNINDQMLWRRIINIVVLTLLVQAPQVQRVEGCFELYGFDILVDENLKPWLLEVNFSPSLGSDCQEDMLAKKPMLHDLLDLLHYTAQDAARGGEGFHQHFQERNFQKRRSVPAQRGGMAGSRRNDRLRAQGRKASRIHSGRTDVSSYGGSRENLSGRLSLTGRQSGSQEDASVGREGWRSRAASDSQHSKREINEVGQKFNSGGGGGGGEVQTAVMDAGGGSRCNAQKGVTTTPMNGTEQIQSTALDTGLVNGQPPDQSSFPGAFSQQHSQTTVSADSHHSGGSEDSKGSKDSGISSGKRSKDSSIGSAGRSSRNAAPQGNIFGSLPEMASSPLHHHRAGSGIRRRDSGCGGEELSLYLPSLENSASSKHSRGRVWTPHRTNYHNDASEQPDESHRHPSGGRFVGQVQENPHGQSGRFGGGIHKAVSTKALPGDGPGKWRQHRESRPPLTHRSTASTVSGQTGFRAGSRLSTTRLRQQSSMSHYPNTLPPTSRTAPGYQPQNKSAQPASAGFSHLKKRVGNFFLVFPFNEATHKVATSLDAKVIIRETQSLIKEALNSVSSSRSSPDHGGPDCGVGRHSEGLWTPLKTGGDET